MGKYKGEKFDIFISYRRDGGEDEAWKLKLFLERSGYRAFMDREALRSGDFNEQLYQCIDGCKDFLLICSPHALARCQNPEDWVRKEIMRALKGKKNIIPVWVNGFDAAEMNQLPEEMKSLAYLQAITPQNATYDQSIQKLCTYLHSRPVIRIRQRIYRAVSLLLMIIVLLCGLFFVSNQISELRTSGFPSTTKETKMMESLSLAALSELGSINSRLSYLNEALETYRYYISGLNTNDAEVKLKALNSKKGIESLSIVTSVYTEPADSYSNGIYLDSLRKTAERTEEYAHYIDYLDTVIFKTNLNDSQRMKVLEQFSRIAEQDAELAVVETFLLFLPVSDPSNTLEQLLDQTTHLSLLSGFGKSWISGEDKTSELLRRMEIAETARHSALISIESTCGVRLSDYQIYIN